MIKVKDYVAIQETNDFKIKYEIAELEHQGEDEYIWMFKNDFKTEEEMLKKYGERFIEVLNIAEVEEEDIARRELQQRIYIYTEGVYND